MRVAPTTASPSYAQSAPSPASNSQTPFKSTIGFLERGDYSPSLKLAFGLSEFFSLPIEAIFSTKPFQPHSQQVYGRADVTPAQKEKQ